mmetsp:Transcript_15513/g.42670  ORF Transcript_15513/g.42670 Transcript_15513/m.42670 type:complete len:203 (-) Transcript_15513:2130-2738(-)
MCRRARCRALAKSGYAASRKKTDEHKGRAQLCTDGASTLMPTRLSTVSAFSTMLLALSSASSYCSSGSLWSIQRSGKTMLRTATGDLSQPSKCPPSNSACWTCAEKPPIEFSSTVISTRCSDASRATSSVSKGLTHRASATVAETPQASRRSAAFWHSRKRDPTERRASVPPRPSRTMRPFPGSKNTGSAGISMSPKLLPRG